MGFLRKALIIGTGGVAPVKANSAKERAAKAAEKQVRLQQQQMRAMARVTSNAQLFSGPSSAVLETPDAPAATAAAQARAQTLAAGGTAADAEATAQHAADAMYRRSMANAPAGEPSAGMASELGRLADLHKQGALTDAEFAAAKAKILG